MIIEIFLLTAMVRIHTIVGLSAKHIIDGTGRYTTDGKQVQVIAISIEDLEDGIHVIESDVDSSELTLSPEEGQFSSPIHLSSKITKMGTDLVLRSDIGVDITCGCSRCLTEFTDRLDAHIDVIYERTERLSINEDDLEESDDLVFLQYDAKELEVGSRVEEAVCLALPLKPLCKEDCKGLCPVCGTDLNANKCDCNTESEDPRWQGLKGLYQPN